jgi:serine/threonine protein kinase
VVHRDLKPENIVLVSNTQIKIIDFGTAEEFDPEEGITLILGTPFYMAPEILNR